MATQPKFFRFKNQVPGLPSDRTPWAMVLSCESERFGEKCGVCGRQSAIFTGPATAEGLRGASWGDIIGAGSAGPGFMVSDRVVNDLLGAGISGFVPHPVTIKSVIDKRMRHAPPKYYVLEIRSRAKFALVPFGDKYFVCSGCERVSYFFPIRASLLQENSWNGALLFEGINEAGPFCTVEVLELARQRRWTNFKFNPADTEHGHASSWDGIDYLGSNWPPTTWYPPSPTEGRTLDKWLVALQSDDPLLGKKAAIAMDDIGKPAVPGLEALLFAARSPRILSRVARVLKYFNSAGILLTPETKKKAVEILENED